MHEFDNTRVLIAGLVLAFEKQFTKVKGVWKWNHLYQIVVRHCQKQQLL